MQEIRTNEVGAFSKSLDRIREEFPDKRSELHRRLGELALREVRRQIGISVNDTGGTVRGWQEKRMGSKRGWVRVAPAKGLKLVGSNSPGAITNYLENGHKTRPPSGTSKRYRPRIKKPYVNGRHFYRSTYAFVQRRVEVEAQRFLDELIKKLEGKAA